MNDNPKIPRGSWRWNWLLALPFVALAWVPFYNSATPMLWGVPFFYWYQLLWVVLTSIIIIFVDRKTC